MTRRSNIYIENKIRQFLNIEKDCDIYYAGIKDGFRIYFIHHKAYKKGQLNGYDDIVKEKDGALYKARNDQMELINYFFQKQMEEKNANNQLECSF